VFSTEHPRYGGHGTPPVDAEDSWRLSAQSALVLRPVLNGKANLEAKKGG
jgi:hypothetical protein